MTPRSTSIAGPSAAAPDTARDFPLRVFFGHHKCATGWIDGILMEISFHLGRHCRIVHTPHHFDPHASLVDLVHAERVDLLAYTNADQRYVQDLPFHRGFHVVRDPRDVIVSAYFSHRNTHSTDDWPELEVHRAALRARSKEEGLLLEMEFSRPQFEAMAAWDYQQEHVLECKMEELTAEPVNGFRRIAAFLGLLEDDDRGSLRDRGRQVVYRMNRLNHRGRRFMPGRLPMFPVPRVPQSTIPTGLLDEILQQASFKRLSGGRRKGDENVHSHYRKGVPGDWKNHFTEQHVRTFKRNYNDLLLKLDYETDPDW